MDICPGKYLKEGRHFLKYLPAFIFFVLPPLAGIPLLKPLSDVVKTPLFCAPSGWMFSVLTGGDFSFSVDTGSVIQSGSLRVLVVPECSGFVFFSILCCSLLLMSKGKHIPAIVLCSYFITLAANTLRILGVCALNANAALFQILPAGLQHQIAGMFIFLTFLMLSIFMFHAYAVSSTEKRKDSNGNTVR